MPLRPKWWFAGVVATSLAIVGCEPEDDSLDGPETGPEASSAADSSVADGGAADQTASEAASGDDSAAAQDGAAEAGDDTGATVEGDVATVHDPSIIAVGSAYYVFSTGDLVPVRTSPDLHTWTKVGTVFSAEPAWITTTDPTDPENLWAPDISYFNGVYHLYYAASRFGVNTSCIGHATASQIDEPGAWQDQGGPILCSSSSDNWNAIDPHAVFDTTGNLWLVFGSFWSGIKLIRLTADGTARSGTELYSLATRANTAVEAPYIVYDNGFYYLFESVDTCCQGVNSTYKIMVGRSTNIVGPYVDEAGVNLSAGGGTLVLQGDALWAGPGSNAVLLSPTGSYNVYHAYDAMNGGVPTLRIAALTWSADAWPISAGP